jgi:hypothetical protein
MHTSDVPTGAEQEYGLVSRRSAFAPAPPSAHAVRRIDSAKPIRSWPAPANNIDDRRIDLRQVRQDVQQPSQSARNRAVHALPHARLRLRVRARVAAVVQNFDEADARSIELLRDHPRMVVAALFHLVPFERRADEDRNDQLSLLPHHLRDRENGACARAFPPRSDQDDNLVRLEERLHLGPRLVQGAPRHLGIMSRPETAGRPGADDDALVSRRRMSRTRSCRGTARRPLKTLG